MTAQHRELLERFEKWHSVHLAAERCEFLDYLAWDLGRAIAGAMFHAASVVRLSA